MGKANLTIQHHSEGGGNAFRMELVYQTDDTPGYLRVTLANLKDGSFDGEVKCPLQFDLVCRVLGVLHGESDDVSDGGKAISLSNGASFAVRRTSDGEVLFAAKAESAFVNFVMKKHEVEGVCSAVEHAMFFLCFIKGITP